MNDTLNGKLRKLIATAYEHTPAMRERMSAAGVSPADIQTTQDLPLLPVLQKDELTQLQETRPPFGGMLAAKIEDLPRIYVSPGPILDPQPAWEGEEREASLAPFRYVGFQRGDRVLNTFAYHITPAGLLFDEALRACGATVLPTGPGNSDVQIMLATQLSASGFIGQPSYLMTLLDKMSQQGIAAADSPFRKALFSAEPYTPTQRSRFEDEYGMKTTSAYGTADLGLFAYTAQGVRGFCVSESVFIEIVDPSDGQTLAAEEVGEIVVTTFNPAYPLIRFGTGDLGALAAAPDPGNPGSQQITGLFGRSGDAVKVRGMFLHPNQLQAVQRRFPQIEKLRATVTRPGHTDVLVIEVELQPKAQEEGIAEGIVQFAMQAARLRVDRVEIVPGGTIADGGKTIVDERAWE
ncbi:MAG: phenylacetate--CoA ligase family protein [Chloroflexi bacterium]|nr:phenylacetate--CoA ligase family protein [Chloroflexota bacterium]